MNIVKKYYPQLKQEKGDIAQMIQQIQRNIHLYNMGDSQRLHRLQLQLDKVNLALARCATGEYGICIACKQSINRERLAIMPSANMCVPCQRKHEKQPYSHHA